MTAETIPPADPARVAAARFDGRFPFLNAPYFQGSLGLTRLENPDAIEGRWDDEFRRRLGETEKGEDRQFTVLAAETIRAYPDLLDQPRAVRDYVTGQFRDLVKYALSKCNDGRTGGPLELTDKDMRTTRASSALALIADQLRQEGKARWEDVVPYTPYRVFSTEVLGPVQNIPQKESPPGEGPIYDTGSLPFIEEAAFQQDLAATPLVDVPLLDRTFSQLLGDQIQSFATNTGGSVGLLTREILTAFPFLLQVPSGLAIDVVNRYKAVIKDAVGRVTDPVTGKPLPLSDGKTVSRARGVIQAVARQLQELHTHPPAQSPPETESLPPPAAPELPVSEPAPELPVPEHHEELPAPEPVPELSPSEPAAPAVEPPPVEPEPLATPPTPEPIPPPAEDHTYLGELIAKNEAVIGTHGVLITPLLRNGPEVNGQRVRRGLPEYRAVSEKSQGQYQVNFAEIFTPPLRTGAPEPEAVTEGRKQIQSVLTLAGLSYLRDNAGPWQIMQSAHLFDTMTSPVVKAHFDEAASYFAELLEGKYKNDMIHDAISRYPNLERDREILQRTLDYIHVHESDLGLKRVLITGIPSYQTNDERQQDTLLLGLTLQEFFAKPETWKEYGLKELFARINE